jgi:hypothetical protein
LQQSTSSHDKEDKEDKELAEHHQHLKMSIGALDVSFLITGS